MSSISLISLCGPLFHQGKSPALQNVDLDGGGQMTMEQLEVVDNMEDLVAQR